jgi:DNA-binding NarL/FixJ family response regulator
MKKIQVTIIAAAAEEYPGCADILGICPEIDIVAQRGGLHGRGLWAALCASDVLVLDEASLDRQGVSVLRTVQHHHPLVRLLLILENTNENKIMDALALGFSGILERASLRSMLRRAIPALYTGETWVSRQLVQSLRTRLLRLDGETLPGMMPGVAAFREKLN